jgi:hypothetical protein
VGSRLV